MPPPAAPTTGRLTVVKMSLSAPIAFSVTLPEMSPPWTICAPSESLRTMKPTVEKLMSPEVTTFSPATFGVRPPIWTAPKLADGDAAGIGFRLDEADLGLQRIGAGADAGAGTQGQAGGNDVGGGVAAAFGDRAGRGQGREGIGAKLVDDDRRRALGVSVRLPTVTVAEPNESATLKIRFTPVVSVTKVIVSTDGQR